jgi:hypothetical protein
VRHDLESRLARNRQSSRSSGYDSNLLVTDVSEEVEISKIRGWRQSVYLILPEI